MSIKENIKSELLKRIENRINLLSQIHNQDLAISSDGEWGQDECSYHEGHMMATDEELIFLDGLKAFIKSL